MSKKDSKKYKVNSVVSVCVERKIDRIPHLLLQRRTKAAEREPYFGLWELPQGRIEFGESILEAARRELREESGLDIGSCLQDDKMTNLSALDTYIEVIAPTLISYDVTNGYFALCVEVTAVGTTSETDEATSHYWFKRTDVEAIIDQHQLFPLNVPMVRSFFSRRES